MMANNNIAPQKTAPLYITRFVAACLVLCHHFFLNSVPVFVNFQEAVVYFFFLSGFVMVVSNKYFFETPTNSHHFNKSKYWVKRAAKIYPMYILAYVACMILMCFVFRTDRFSLPSFCYELLGIQTWLDKESLNYPGWSLSCELFFYAVFPFTLRFLANSSLKRVGIITIVLFCLNIALNVYLSRFYKVANTGNWILNILTGASISQNPIFRYPVFLFGNFAGIVYLRCFKSVKVANIYGLSACVLCIVFIMIVTQWLPSKSPLLLNGVLCPVYFILILAVCSFNGKVLGFLSSKIFILAGGISYGCYIMQVPVQLLFKYLFNGNKNFSSIGIFCAFILVLVTVSFLLYKYFEFPVKNFILLKFVR